MSIVPYGFASPVVRDYRPVEADVLVPITVQSQVAEDFAIRNGLPDVPKYWVQAITAVTANGTHFTDRISITDINDDVLVRFVPTEDTFDPITFTWSPLTSVTISRYDLDADPLTAPTLTDADYILAKELFSVGAMSFDQGQLVTTDFDGGVDDTVYLTVAAALRFSGTRFDFLVFADGSKVTVTEFGVSATVNGRSMKLTLPAGPLASAPLYLILQIAPPRVTLCCGYSPTKLFVATSPVPIRTTSLHFTLNGPVELYSLDLWGDNAPDLIEIIRRYSSALGSSSGRMS
jgi:hypothetical protein